MLHVYGRSPVKSQEFLLLLITLKLIKDPYVHSRADGEKHVHSCMKDESSSITSLFLSLDLNGCHVELK